MPMDLQYRNPGNRALLDLLDIPPGRVLDCGCGAGDNARLLRQQGWQVTGVTLDPAELVAATAECVATELADLSAGLPFAADGSFDLVLLSHILEHLVDPAALIAEARRVLAPGGRIAIALPNVAHFRQRALHLLGRFEYTETGVMDSTHVRFFTVETARRLLETNGLAILASDASGGLPWWHSRRLLPRELAARADRWALANRPNLFAWQAVFLTVPTGGPVPVVEQRSRRHTEESARPVPAAPPGRVSPGPSSG